MNIRNATLAAAVAAILGMAPGASHAQATTATPIKWYGSIYAKFLDGNHRNENGLYSNAETTPGEGGGDQGQGIPLLIERLGILRVYTKLPGHPPERDRPFTVRRGATVHDVAFLVHRGRAGDLKFARIWGPSVAFEGQQVSANHPIADRDVVELHW